MSRLAVSWLGVAAVPVHARTIPILAVLSGVGNRLAVSWIGVVGEAAIADVHGSGDAHGLPGDVLGQGSVQGPFVPMPVYGPAAGGIIHAPSKPKRVSKPKPIHATAKAQGFAATAQGSARVFAPVSTAVILSGNPGFVRAQAQVEPPPTVARIEVAGSQARLASHGRVLAPRRAKAHVSNPRGGLNGTARVIDPARGSGAARATATSARSTGLVVRPLSWELEELWLIGVGSGETDEELVLA